MFWINRSLHFNTVQPDSSHRVHVCRLKTWGSTTRSSTLRLRHVCFTLTNNGETTESQPSCHYHYNHDIIMFTSYYHHCFSTWVFKHQTSSSGVESDKYLMFSQLTAQVLSHLQQLLPSYRISKIQDHLQDSIHRNLRRWLTDVVQILVAQRNNQRNAWNILPRTTWIGNFACVGRVGSFNRRWSILVSWLLKNSRIIGFKFQPRSAMWKSLRWSWLPQ